MIYHFPLPKNIYNISDLKLQTIAMYREERVEEETRKHAKIFFSFKRKT